MLDTLLKKIQSPNRSVNDSGIILIAVLWILVILTVLAVGLGRQAGIQFSLTKYLVGKTKTKYLDLQGFSYVLNQIRRDSADAKSSTFDTLYQCGFVLDENQMPADLFKNIKTQAGHFDVVNETVDQKGNSVVNYGLSDEDGKLNINALAPTDIGILEQLITGTGVDEKTSRVIAASVMDWRDSDNTVTNDPDGAEEEYYAALGYHCKNKPFDTIEELMLVRGMTPDIFKAIKNFVTVYPKTGTLTLNIDTAPYPVLVAFAQSFSGGATNTTLEDATSLADKILEWRNGPDGIPGTSDDRAIDAAKMDLNSSEQALMLTIQSHSKKVSQYLTAHIRATDEASSVTTNLDVTIKRDNLSVLHWQRH